MTSPIPTVDALTVELRGYTQSMEPKPDYERLDPPADPPGILVFDCETTIDTHQSLLFGCWQVWHPDANQHLQCIEEGLFHPDDIDDRTLTLMRKYCDTHRPRVKSNIPAARQTIMLVPASRFIESRLFRQVWHGKLTCVGFNLPFDLSRLATHWGEARDGGFSLRLAPPKSGSITAENPAGEENQFRPRLTIKHLDPRKAFIGFRGTAERDDDGRRKRRQPGTFIELRAAVHAYTNRSHTLASACAAMKVDGYDALKDGVEHGKVTAEYIDYNRRDVAATAALYQAVLAEHQLRDNGKPLSKIYSPASDGKGCLDQMGLIPILERQPDFPTEVLAYAMESFYGGRVECMVRRLAAPVRHYDYKSMYPTVNALMGCWAMVTADHIEAIDSTEETRRKLDSITGPADMLDPDAWQGLVTLCLIELCDGSDGTVGDVLPIRARYERDHRNIGINHLYASDAHDTQWFALPDLIASKLLHPDGRSPVILRAITLRAVGQQSGLRAFKVRSEIPVDPAKEDFFISLIEKRTTLTPEQGGPKGPIGEALKATANGCSYGIYSEFVRHDEQRGATVTTPNGTFTDERAILEEPGRWCFPPIAAAITSAARLMLALLERMVRDDGGSYVFCDTDSMSIVATDAGGHVELTDADGQAHTLNALSGVQCERIVDRFTGLSPYDRTIVPGSILQPEYESGEQLWCYSISSKRYALFNVKPDRNGRPRIDIRKYSEHGLGAYLNPQGAGKKTGWVEGVWRQILREDALKLDEPGSKIQTWTREPVITQMAISSPAMLRPFHADRKLIDHTRPVSEQPRPFNFMILASCQGAPVANMADWQSEAGRISTTPRKR